VTKSVESGSYVEPCEFKRDTNYITTRITADGRDGYPVEPAATDWLRRGPAVGESHADRAPLLGLEGVLSLGLCGPTHDKLSWTFDLDPGGVDPVLGIPGCMTRIWRGSPTIRTASRCPRSSTCRPAGGDQRLRADHAGFRHRVDRVPRKGAPQLYPEALRAEIDEANLAVFRDVNNGVYRLVSPGHRILRGRLRSALRPTGPASRNGLRRNAIWSATRSTEADVRLFTTLARFDPVITATSSATGPS